MKKPICYIAGAGDMGGEPPVLREGDLLIAADAGYTALRRLGLLPDLAVGDFDSLGSPPEGVEVIRHPVRKDDTDMLLAVRVGLNRGFREFRLYGGTGGRLDHTAANLQVLAFLAHSHARGYLIGSSQTVTALSDGSLTFQSRTGGILSVFAQGGQACGVTLRGLSYPLSDAVLFPEKPLGVSNAFIGETAVITVNNGTLLIFWDGTPDDVQDTDEHK